MPLVSVIMGSYNYEHYIARAIESVLAQTFVDFELIVIDDLSADGSREVIRRYAALDPRVKPVFHSINAGIAKTYNEGIDLARGKFVAFLDSDDLWAPDKLEKQVSVLMKDEDLVVWSNGEIINRHSRPVGLRFTQFHRSGEKKKSGDIFSELLQGNFILGSSLIVKKDNLAGLRFNAGIRYSADYLFFLDLASRYRFYFIDECLAMYRVHGNNVTLRSRDALNSDLLSTCKFILGKYRARLDEKQLSRLLCYSSVLYSRAYMFRDSLGTLYEGIRTYPPNAYYVLLLPLSLAKYLLLYRFSGRWDPFRRLVDAA